MKQTGIAAYNPITCFAYFVGAIVLGVITMHPACLLLQLFFATTASLVMRKKFTAGKCLLLLCLFIVLSLANPLFNTKGETILFSYWGRSFTLEALLFGSMLAAMFIAMLIWFGAFDFIMSEDKVLYIFGKRLSHIGMIVSMVLKFVPEYTRYIREISEARRGIGKNADKENKKSEAAKVMTAVTAWSLENGVVTSESMKNRGYGAGERSTFSLYSIKRRDIILLVICALLFLTALICKLKGGFDAQYFPQIKMEGTDNFYFILGIFSMMFYYMLPICINVTEDIKWHILKSGI